MTTLYRAYDEDGFLLYVGISVNWQRRQRDHMLNEPWWPTVLWCDLEEFPTRQAALAAERAAIGTERPLHNVQHNPYAVEQRQFADRLDRISARNTLRREEWATDQAWELMGATPLEEEW